MQIVCEKCGEQSDGFAIEVVDGHVRATCKACGASSRLGGDSPPPAESADVASAARAPEAKSAPAAVQHRMPDPLLAAPVAARAHSLEPAADGTIKCPKCANRQRARKSCSQCGLVFANLRDGVAPWERWPPEKQPAIRKAKTLWAAVEAAPHLAHPHAEFVAFSKSQAIADFAAMRYRHFVADNPNEPLAQQYLEESVKNAHALAAMMLNTEQRQGAPAQVQRLRLFVGFGVVLVTVTLFVFAIRFYLASSGLR